MDLNRTRISPVVDFLVVLIARLALEACIERCHIPNAKQKLGKLRGRTFAHIQSHYSYLDPVLYKAAISQLGLPSPYIATAQALLQGLSGRLLHNSGCFPIDRAMIERAKSSRDTAYGRSLQEFMADKLKSGKSVMFYPTAQRSRTGAIDDSLGEFGGIFLKPLLQAQKESQQSIDVLISSISYDWIPDIREFEYEARTGERMPHLEMYQMLLELASAGKRRTIFYTLLKRVLKLTRRPFGNAYVHLSIPLSLGNYVSKNGNSLQSLREAILTEFRKTIVTETMLIGADIYELKETSQAHLEDIVARQVEELQAADVALAPQIPHSSPKEIIAYAMKFLLAEGVVNMRGSVYTEANESATRYLFNRAKYQLEKTSALRFARKT